MNRFTISLCILITVNSIGSAHADNRDINIFCVLSEKEFNRPDFSKLFTEQCGLLLVESAPENFIQDLRRKNSKTIALLTTNPYFAASDLFWGSEGPIPPEKVKPDWVLRAQNGKVIKYNGPLYHGMDSNDLPTIMDIRNKEWQKDFIRFAKFAVNENQLDGIFLDTWSSEIPGWALGPNNAFPKDFTDESWENAMKDFTQLLKKGFQDKLIVYNGIGSDPFDRKAALGDTQYLEDFDGVSSEAYSIYWKMDSDDETKQHYFDQTIMGAMQYAKERNKIFILEATLDINNQKSRLYALTSYLLLQYDKSFFYATAQEQGGPWAWQSEWDISLGRPLGEYYQAEGVYQRDFDKAKVVVNPTSHSVVLSDLQGYVDLDGQAIHQIKLGKFEGTILRFP